MAEVLRALLDAAPGLHVVVTSQVPLRLAAERVVRLGPLPTPDAALPPGEAMTYGAVALFVERVQALQRSFELSEGNVNAVCSLCRRLDGSALAIELAAARVPLLGVHGLEQCLDERLELLTKGWRDAPSRQHTLRAALDWSHALLDADEQRLFRRLSVFAGSFSLDLAHRVVSDEALDRRRLIDTLDALVDHSLVAVDAADPPRYRLLESPLALAREHLIASGEAATLLERHARVVSEHFLALNADGASGRLRLGQVLERLSPDLDNGRMAMAWALQTRRSDGRRAGEPADQRLRPPARDRGAPAVAGDRGPARPRHAGRTAPALDPRRDPVPLHRAARRRGLPPCASGGRAGTAAARRRIAGTGTGHHRRRRRDARRGRAARRDRRDARARDTADAAADAHQQRPGRVRSRAPRRRHRALRGSRAPLASS